jgi:hypothetical protein
MVAHAQPWAVPAGSALPYPGEVKFPRLRTADSPAVEVDDAVVEETTQSPAYTPGKGRPTPKRREAETRKRGPVAPPPKTQREASRRTRVTKEQRRSAAAERRAGMASGDERHMLPRDKGPVKAFVRDVVDSRRHLAGLFMPLALLVLVTLVAPVPQIQAYAAPGTLVILVIMIIEGVLNGRNVVKRVREKFPKAADSSMSLGWYSFVRSSQIRKLRMPKPRVNVGDTIA